MKHFKRPGIWLGVIALVLAMTGSAFATASITGGKVKDGTLTGRDIKNRSLTSADLSSGTVQGLRGASGPQGPQGPAGPSAVSQVTKISSGNVYFTSSSYAQSAIAYCPAGQRVVSGGGASISGSGLAASEPNADRTGWFVVGGSSYYSTTQYVEATAICAASGAAVASSVGNHAADAAKLKALVAKTDARMATIAR